MGTECGECRECSLRFKESLRGFGKCYYFNILGNVQEDCGECLRTLREMLHNIPGNVIKDSGECCRRFWGILWKIPGNVQVDSRECY